MKLKDFIGNIFKKLGTLFHEVKEPKDWSSTTFLSVFVVVVPVLVWVILSCITGLILAIPESVVVIVIAGLTGKVFSQNNKFNSEKTNGK